MGKSKFAALVALALCAGCFSVESKHEIKPIHIKIDINLKVDRALDDFFGDLDKQTIKETEKKK